MQLFKKRNESSETGAIAWHPSFRNTAELPDTKTVRTHFFINTAIGCALLGAALYFAYGEYRLQEANHQLAGVEAQIEEQTKPSREAVALYKQFQTEEAKLKEFVAFTSGEKVILSDAILSVAEMLPNYVRISGIQYNGVEFVMRGIVEQPAEVAAGTASQFEKQLRENPPVAGVESVSLTSLLRDQSTGFQRFEMTIRLKR